ncbi:chaperone TorD involved in molybdoenzyme TorA maturation [Anaerobranca californiensis DSM 14826]|uniref:Chaperone TorD involved in molybdoenzyme TorA maturation n=1 Tax=Anaerobranca californiensis DSM 14826 TaxID=1120989 RepID=A0A1M6QV00_9FIRM|nr:molecular chaperone TorD family protein [Anaerobranca californiensis]SHK23953.1 chaperone TorD involved in molybdoenzyme TorA maturation [Anaerobranca californiensis DSM 14826]
MALYKLYFLLSYCFYKPDNELIHLLKEEGIELLKNKFNEKPSICKSLIDLREEIQKDNILDELAWEYNRLFFGPGKVLVPPYSSLYINSYGHIMTKITKQVNEAYKAWGFKVSEDLKEPADHIAIELSFLANLYKLLEENTEQREAILLQIQEFKDHLREWFPKFKSEIEKNQSLRFYGIIAQIVEELLKKD